ncbi:restriction endonuclease subunit S [Latilactobacillus curvatus]|uniref:restriction endonuclease subunit S n=1 Tax=Latilactobacillus curvatus TaxID=28038 RepID=UPI0021AF3D9D|nr:restriction endonuclease subunit S [Latilactobacillus curvatus]MCS8581810.1 restriction endonuclease subunit S [Latilactobacillus curvatus]MCS8605715.1 restriction endonuclease subunit S [Latilactobacillus curvatus]
MEEIKYDQMKDSGIEWIGNIPKEWDLIPLKQVASFKTGGTPPLSEGVNFEKGLPWFKPSDFSADISLLSNSENFINFESVKRNRINVFPRNTLLMITIASIGRVGLLEQDSYSNQQITALTIKDQNKLLPKYLLYVSGTLAKYLKESTMSSVVPIVNINFLSSCKVPMPNINEQINIVDYLENELKKIENIIDKAKRSLKLLNKIRKSIIFETVTKGLDNNVEMKDSGVEWIGEIPVDWEYSKICYTTRLNGRIGWQGLTSDEYTDEGPYLITGTDFTEGKVNLETAVHISYKRWQEAKEIQVKNGDLLITKDGTVGKVAMIDGLDSEASLNSGVLRIRTYNQVDTRYLYWILNSEVFWNWFNYTNGGNSTILHLYQNVFEKFSFPLPNIAVQKKISDFLDENISTLDESIKKVEESISLAEQIKKSLIYEYTTGKKRVRL